MDADPRGLATTGPVDDGEVVEAERLTALIYGSVPDQGGPEKPEQPMSTSGESETTESEHEEDGHAGDEDEGAESEGSE